MADESDRNLWDALGLPKKTDLSSVQEREQSLCTNGSQEGDLDKAQSDIVQGTSLTQKDTAERSSVSIADVPCCSDSPDVPVKNGGDMNEQRHIQKRSVIKILTNQGRDLPVEKVELNGETTTAPNYSASVTNGSIEPNVEPLGIAPETVEHSVIKAVNTNNNKQAESTTVRQDRSIFEHFNSNFRPVVALSPNHVRENVARETGMHRATSQTMTTVSSNVSCLPVEGTIRNVEASGNKDRNNIFERVRINSYIDSLAQKKITREGNGGFPFSEKLRQLTTIIKEPGTTISNTGHPLRTGYDTVTSGRAFQQPAPVSTPPSAANAIAARIVNGQLQSPGTQVVTPPEVSQVESNVIFPSLRPTKFSNAVSTSLTVNNSYPNHEVVSGYNAMNGTAAVRSNAVTETNSVIVQPNAVAKLKRIAAERPNGEHTQTNLAATHLVGPFISTVPPPPNTYVASVRTAHAHTLINDPKSLAYPHLQDVRSTLKGHSSSSGFQLVLPVFSPVGISPSSVVNRILPPPISLTSREVNTLSNDKQRNLICGERLVPSPDLQDRIFRPVSPARSGMNTSTSPRARHERVSYNGSTGFHSSPMRARRSIFSRKTDIESRGSVEQELADQSYECALRESANSPDIERYLRCESPLTVLRSPNAKSTSSSHESISMESTESHVNSSALCNGESENIEIPNPSLEESTEGFSSSKIRESTDSEISGEETDASMKKLNSVMVRRLEPRLPSPVRERSGGDLYRDPSELTREERALQRAMMQFSEMESKEKEKEIKKKDSLKRRLRKRPKDKPNAIANDTTKQSATKVWLKKFKRKRLWFSQRRSITVKPPVQEDDSSLKSSENQQTQPIKRKRSNSKNDNVEQQPKVRRTSVETVTDKRDLVAKPKDVPQTTAVLPNHMYTDTKPDKVRRSSSDTRGLKKNKKENLPESTSCKRSSDTEDLNMGKKVVKRAREEIEPLKVKRQEVIPSSDDDSAKADKSHRVKTYMLVTAYQGFRDFKPLVLDSRTRGKSKQTDEEPQQETSKTSEFPLLVVESVHSKPVKNSIIAENEEVQHFVENCLKARGKWQIDETVEESMNEDETLKEARKLNVNRNTGETILHKAARLGYHETVHHHIHQGIDPNAKDNAGWTPLHEACSRGHVDVVKVLAKYGADVNACSNDGIRPIHDAAEGGHVNVLRVLLSYGADPLLATYSGNTALSCTREPKARAFLEGFLEDLDLKTSSSSANESEGCWDFSGSCPVMDAVPDHTSGIFDGAPGSKGFLGGEFEICDRPHLPTYNLPVMTSDDVTSGRRNYVLLADVLEHLRISRGALFKKARRLDIHEMPWSHFMAEIADKPLCIVPKYSPPDSSTQEGVAELVTINYNLRRLLNIRIESVNMT